MGDAVLPKPLQDRVALVTGAATIGGLGFACARALAQAGAKMAICDINDAALAQAQAQLQAEGFDCLALHCDVSSSAQVDAMFAQIVQHYGSLHILMNNAALVPVRPVDALRRETYYRYLSTPEPRRSLQFTSTLTDEEWARYWDVNVHGLFYCTRAALRIMEPQRDGKIINVASVAGISDMSVHSPHYSASKGAVVAFSRAVAAEVAGAHIFVNVLAPGGVETPDFKAYLAHVGPEKANQLWQQVPLGRLGTPEEYAATVVHLAGSHYLVGQVISPNGGCVI